MNNKLPDGIIGGGSVKKKPIGERLAETFLGGSIKDAKSYVVREVIVPKIKELVYESITGSIDKLINGGSGGKKSSYSSYTVYPTTYTSYNNYNNTPKLSQVFGSGSSRAPAVITLAHKTDADYVLSRMVEYLQHYPEGVTVSTYYEACREVLEAGGVKSDISKVMSYTDEYYGWTDLSGARVRPHEGGYIVQLPPTIQLR